MAEESAGTKKRKRGIQAALDAADEERRRKLLSQRIDIARIGVLSYQKHRVGDAAKSFHSYIRILEELKGCQEGGLMPTHFDFKKDLQEMLLISGVYWDLAKMYDHSQTPDKVREFHHYLRKYIIFSKNMPYQVLCAETMRKYLSTGHPVHSKEFKQAYVEITGTRCFVATSLVDVIGERTIDQLREFRDTQLLKSRTGRVFVRIYYAAGPSLAALLDRAPRGVRIRVARRLDAMARLLERRADSTRME